MKWKCLPQEALKLLACVTMLIDHVGYLFFPQNITLRLIGRLSFPLYCFLLTQGVAHTRSRGKYMLRLLLTAVLSELCFDLAFHRGFTWEKQSVMVTLLFGAAMVWGMELVCKGLKKPIACLERKNKYLGILTEALAMGLVFFPFHYIIGRFRSDYGWKGIFLIAMFVTTRRLPLKNLFRGLLMIWLAYISSSRIHYAGFTFPFQLPAVLALLPIALYSGKKLTRNKTLQWSFQLFYPVHLLLLWVILQFM